MSLNTINSLQHSLMLIGFASAMATKDTETALGPWDIYYSSLLQNEFKLNLHWVDMIYGGSNKKGLSVLPDLISLLQQAGEAVLQCIAKEQSWCVLGGDHSSALGVWSAVAYAKREVGDIGLLWVDAHMDAHIPDSSPSKNFHGMPLAHLLGYGEPALSQLFDKQVKLLPQNVCLLGLRSYEPEEKELLNSLGVRCYFMRDIQEKGLQDVLHSAVEHVSKHTIGFGVSIDLDAFTPEDIPGVSCPEAGGLSFQEFINACSNSIKSCIGFEIAEYNPLKDKDKQTQQAIFKLLQFISSLD